MACQGSNGIPGYDGTFFLSKDGGSNFNRFAEIKDMELSISNDLFDANNHDTKGWSTSVDGIKSWEITGSANFVNADVGQNDVRDVILSGATAEVEFKVAEGVGIVQYKGCGFFRNIAISSPSDNLTEFGFEFTGTGELFKSVQA